MPNSSAVGPVAISFPLKRLQSEAEIEVSITVKETSRQRRAVRCNSSLKRKSRPIRESGHIQPAGGGETLDALLACVRQINRFPCEAGTTEAEDVSDACLPSPKSP